MATLTLKPGSISLADLRRIARGSDAIALADGWRGPVEASLAAVRARLAAGESLYGINTGFGKLAKTRISDDELATLQLYLMRSHAAGVGEPLADSTVRLILVLKAASLARGFSGVRAVVIERLLALVNAGIHPVVPSQGSVGASGDLAPLAHLSLALIGEGRVRVKGQEQDCVAALKAAGIEPLELGPKEGLALLNGTQVSTALALEALFAAEDLLAGSILTGAMSVDAALGSRMPFDARIHNARGQPAQIAVAAAFRAVLGESDIGRSHENCDRVQDPYSLRCQPQVAGACLQQIHDVARTLMLEANGVSDNPLVFGKEGDVLSGGNFHAEPVAFAADNLALAIAEIGALVRAAHRDADRRQPEPAARVPGAAGRAQLRVHDRAGDRGGARLGEQVARAPGLGRQPADLRQPGGSRQHGDLRRAPPRADGGEHARRARDRAARRGAGHRFPPPARVEPGARIGARAPAQARRLLRPRPPLRPRHRGREVRHRERRTPLTRPVRPHPEPIAVRSARGSGGILARSRRNFMRSLARPRHLRAAERRELADAPARTSRRDPERASIVLPSERRWSRRRSRGALLRRWMLREPPH